MICIYMWKNKVTNTVLIGQTINSTRRKFEHLYKVRKNLHPNKYFQNSWNKYKEESFEFLILEEIKNKSFLTAYEQKYVDFYKTLPSGVYNLAGPTENPRRGIPLTSEHKTKISIGNTGKIRTLEAKIKYSKNQLGKKRPRTLQHTENFKIARTGKKLKKHSEEVKRQKSISVAQRYKNPKGYYFDKRSSRFIANIKVFGKRIVLGYFILEEDARNAYLKAKEERGY